MATWDVLRFDLTKKQRAVVIWCYENDASPYDAARAGICHSRSVDSWGSNQTVEWIKAYAASVGPSTAEVAKEIRDGMLDLLRPAMRVMADTLAEGTGNATAVKTAQWVLDGLLVASEGESSAPPQEDDGLDELTNVLSMLNRK